MVNKRGWIRMMEVVLAVTIFSTVLLVIYSQQVEHSDGSVLIRNIQKRISNEISISDDLRKIILLENETELKGYFSEDIPYGYNLEFRICSMEEYAQPCKLYDYSEIYDKQIYVESLIISGNLTDYNPKLVNIFMWGDI